MSKKKTNADFLKELAAVNPNIIICDEYQGAHAKLHCRCKIDGYEWNAPPHSLLRGNGCPRCSKKERYTPSSFRERLASVNPDVVAITEYHNAYTPVTFRCKKDGFEWTVTPAHLITGESGCPMCAGVVRKNTSKFIEEMRVVNPDVVVRGEYINCMTPIKCMCSRCGKEWQGTPNAMLRGDGCPHCNMSTGERRIAQFFEQHNIEYIFQHRFADCRDKHTLPFDFYVPLLNVLVEYDGEQHFYPVAFHRDARLAPEDAFENIQRHDAIKNHYCDEHHYRLIRIAYTDCDRITTILNELLA